MKIKLYVSRHANDVLTRFNTDFSHGDFPPSGQPNPVNKVLLQTVPYENTNPKLR